MTILALDSGFDKTGYAVLEKNNQQINLLTSGLIKTIRADKIEVRLNDIYQKIDQLINQYQPEKLILEQLFFFKNQKTIVRVSQAQGVTLLLAGQKKLQVELLSPLQIKQIVTGYGQADKKAVEKMLRLQLRLNQKFHDDDEVDAIACGYAYCLQNPSLR